MRMFITTAIPSDDLYLKWCITMGFEETFYICMDHKTIDLGKYRKWSERYK
jgi:hypothetical protein